MASPTPRWGFIGTSSFAANYVLPALRAAGGKCVGVVSESSSERAQSYAAENEVERAFDSLEDLLADERIDAVLVCGHNDSHARATVAAARAGKHVLCEKPLALTVEDAEAMVAACANAGVVLATNHHLRCQTSIRAMRQLVAQGEIGRVLAARVFHARLLPSHLRTWRAAEVERGGGVTLDLGVHDADTLRFLLQDEIHDVAALTVQQGIAVGRVEDGVMGVLTMRRGTLASFHAAFTLAHAGTGLELHGTEGSLIGRDLLAPDPVGDVFLRRVDTVDPIEIGERADPFTVLIGSFHHALNGAGRPAASGEDGVASLSFALAALESARTGQRVQLT